ncbi:MAG: hypothetical protein AAFX92_00470 [Pseudomonadota bacterium]
MIFLFDVGDFALHCRNEDHGIRQVFHKLVAPLAVDCRKFPSEGSYGPIHASEFDANRDRTFEIHFYVNRIAWKPRLTACFSETLAIEQAETNYRNVEGPSLQWAPVASQVQQGAARQSIGDSLRVH